MIKSPESIFQSALGNSDEVAVDEHSRKIAIDLLKQRFFSLSYKIHVDLHLGIVVNALKLRV